MSTRSRSAAKSPWTLASAAAALALVLAAGAWPLVSGTATPIWDAGTFYAPSQMLVADFARAGKLLTWDPWLSGGRPDHADPQVGAASPLNVGIGLLTGGAAVRGFVFYWFTIWWLGACGVLLLARSLGAPSWAGLLGGLAFLACGFNTGHGQHTTFVVGFSLLPWIIWRLDRAIRTGSRLAALQAGALLGLAGLSGYPGVVILNGLYAAVWAIGRLLFGEQGARPVDSPSGGGQTPTIAVRIRAKTRIAVVVTPLVAVISLVVLAPTYSTFFGEGRDYSERVRPLDRYWAVERGSLPPAALETFVSPAANVLKLEHGDLWRGLDTSMISVYVLPLALLLALVGLIHQWRDPWKWWLLATGALFLAAALGHHTPVRGWLYDLVPPTRFFRFSAIFRGYWIFSCIALALEASRGSGLHRRRAPWLTLAGASVVFGLAALAMARGLWARVGLSWDWDGWSSLMLLAWLGPAAVALLVLSNDRPAFRRAAVAGLAALAAIDAVGALRFSEPLRSTPSTVHMEKWALVREEHDGSLDLKAAGRERLARSPYGPRHNGNVIAKLPVFGSYDPFRNLFHHAWTRDELLTQFVTGENRFWFAAQALPLTLTSIDETTLVGPRDPPPALPQFEEFRARAHEIDAPVLVVHPPAGVLPEGPTTNLPLAEMPPMQTITVRKVRYEPESLALDVTTEEDGWLLVTDRHTKSWSATVDGRPAQMLLADFIFRAVPLGAGSHRVVFEYRSTRYRLLVALSWCTLLAIALASWRDSRRRRSPARRLASR